MFVGRTEELSSLEELYASDKFEMPIIYGRRRVGKTALIREFIKNKEAVFFTGIEASEQQNLENLSSSIYFHITKRVSTLSYPSFQAALEEVFNQAESKRLVLVLDEYPYLAKSYKPFSSILQMLIDKYKDSSQLMLILCGSSMSFMEEQVLGYQSPLYGRRTAQYKIEPFDFFETCQYFSSFAKVEIAELYGILGGTPQYLLQMNPKISLKDNIIRQLLTPDRFLFEEPNNLLKQEVREAAAYNAVLAAIAGGCSRLSDIANKVGMTTGMCTTYLNRLMALGLVKKETPYGGEQTKKTIYLLQDNLFRFWYRFIPGNVDYIQNKMAEIAYAEIQKDFNGYMGFVFEDICKQYLWRQNRLGKLPFVFASLGRWWGTDPKLRKETEVDIIASDGRTKAIIAECKWRNEDVSKEVLLTLMERSRLFGYDNKYLYLFSKTGFTEACQNLAKELGNVELISFANMVDR